MNEHSYLNKRLSCQFLSKYPLLWERSPRSLVETLKNPRTLRFLLKSIRIVFPYK